MQSFKECTKESTLISFGLLDWYNDMSSHMKNPKKYKSKYTPEEKDMIMRELKVGPYRTWQFDKKRFDEIARDCYEDRSEVMIKQGVTYLREQYPQYSDLSDEEIITKGLYRILFSDRMKKSQYVREQQKKVNEADYAEFMQ